MRIGKIFNGFEKFLVNTCEYAKFLFCRLQEIRRYGDYRFPYRGDFTGKRFYVLANGPSLKNEINALKDDELFKSSPKFVVNYFINSPLFQELKPEYYCMADPAFFKYFKRDKYKALYEKINTEVRWPITLLVPNWGEEVVKSHINNNNITIVSISPLRYTGFDCFKYRYYKAGKGMPCYVNVTIMIEFFLINMGCKDIWLYGVDHTFLNNLVVDDDNVLRVEDTHFYGNKKVYADVHEDGTPWGVSEFIYNKYLTFVEHENMRGYADYMGARIVNCTKNSWIDAYVRLTQQEKE